MEIASIKPRFDFRIKPSHDAKTFPNAGTNNFISATAPQFQLSDVEMVTFDATPYTSLKDLLPASPSPPSLIMSPNFNSYSGKDSRREIPIKDPLLQHAAWAYLQPMSTHHPHDGGGCNRNLMNNLKDRCSRVFCCFNDVVLVLLHNFFFFKAEAGAGGIDDKSPSPSSSSSYYAKEDKSS